MEQVCETDHKHHAQTMTNEQKNFKRRISIELNNIEENSCLHRLSLNLLHRCVLEIKPLSVRLWYTGCFCAVFGASLYKTRLASDNSFYSDLSRIFQSTNLRKWANFNWAQLASKVHLLIRTWTTSSSASRYLRLQDAWSFYAATIQ